MFYWLFRDRAKSLKHALLSGALCIVSSSAMSASSIQNSGFEDPVTVSNTFSILPETSVPGWRFDPTGPQTSGSIEIWDSGFQSVPAFEGNQFAEVNSNTTGALYQVLDTFAGEVMDISLSHRGRAGSDTVGLRVYDVATGDLLYSEDFTTGNTSWAEYAANVTATGSLTRVEFISVATASNSASIGNFLDVIQGGPSGRANVSMMQNANLDGCGLTQHNAVAELAARHITSQMHDHMRRIEDHWVGQDGLSRDNSLSGLKAAALGQNSPSLQRAEHSAFASVSGGYFRQDGVAKRTSSVEHYGAVAGGDHWNSARLAVGTFGEMSAQNASTASGACNYASQRIGAGFFATKRFDNRLSVNLVAGGAYGDVDVDRASGFLTEQIEGKTDYIQFYADMRVSRAYAAGRGIFHPFIGVRAETSWLDGFAEKSTNINNLGYDLHNSGSAYVLAGLDFSRDFQIARDSVLRIQIGSHIEAKLFEGATSTNSQMSFFNTLFKTEMDPLDDVRAVLSLDADFLPWSEDSLQFGFSGQASLGNHESYSLSGKMNARLPF